MSVLSTNEEIEFVKYNSYYSSKHKLFYISTPKVACTSLKWWFADLLGYTSIIRQHRDSMESSPELVIHDTFHIVAPEVTHLPRDPLERILESDEVLHFAVVRNPYKRIFSAWQSKLLLQEPLQSQPYQGKRFFDFDITQPSDITEAFELFLEHLMNNESPNFWDLHWTPQSDLLSSGAIPHLQVAQIENTRELEQRLAERLGESFVNPFSTKHANESLIAYSEKYISPRSAEIIRTLYRADFERFGYSLEVPSSRTRMSDEAFCLARKGIEMIRARHARIGDFRMHVGNLQSQTESERSQFTQEKAALRSTIEVQANSLSALGEKLAEQETRARATTQTLDRLAAREQELHQQLLLQAGVIDRQSDALRTYSAAFSALFSSPAWKLLAALRQAPGSPSRTLARFVASAVRFEPGAYLAANPDIAGAHLPPAEHFLAHGLIEGRLFSPLAQLGWAGNASPRQEVSKFAGEDATLATPSGSKQVGYQDDFDSEFYLSIYPDLRQAGVDPFEHYQKYGRSEGRLGSLPALLLRGNLEGFNTERQTVLIVSHEASRTGAPILSLNLVQTLSQSHNVLALLLGGGELEGAFLASGAVVAGPIEMRGNPNLAERIMNKLLDRYSIDFALVNSIESRVVLPALSTRFIPCVSLIHEFAAYTRPRGAFRDALLWSGATVFSAELTLESAQNEFPEQVLQRPYILPQGRCTVPTENFDHASLEQERMRVRSALCSDEQRFVVLGAGFVQLRKGVDLFIECAARVVASPGGEDCLFVWAGQGYDPERDTAYSVYLCDQIRRAGLEDHVKFIGETAAIETAYAESDILLLTSRLDPLPNVAIDAMDHGLPVICFDKTTGIADFLKASGMGDECVAPFLDTQIMAEQVLAIRHSEQLLRKLQRRSQESSRSYFNMDGYVAALRSIARDVQSRVQQEQQDAGVLEHSALLRFDFLLPESERQMDHSVVLRRYVRAWACGIGLRKPFPGFNPAIFRKRTPSNAIQGDPLAAYIRAGQPAGPWKHPVLSPASSTLPLRNEARVALHIHVSDPDQLPDILRRLALNQAKLDLLISVTTASSKEAAAEHLRAFSGTVLKLEVVPGESSEFAALLSIFSKQLVDEYDFVGHLHTQGAPAGLDTPMSGSIQRFVLDNLLGNGDAPMADIILSHLVSQTEVGLVFPDDPVITDWPQDKPLVATLARRLGLAVDTLPDNQDTPLAAMFWARSEILRPLTTEISGWCSNLDAALPRDVSRFRIVAQLLPLLTEQAGLTIALTNVPGVTR